MPEKSKVIVFVMQPKVNAVFGTPKGGQEPPIKTVGFKLK